VDEVWESDEKHDLYILAREGPERELRVRLCLRFQKIQF
jgi:hypothetical protein